MAKDLTLQEMAELLADLQARLDAIDPGLDRLWEQREEARIEAYALASAVALVHAMSKGDIDLDAKTHEILDSAIRSVRSNDRLVGRSAPYWPKEG